MNERIDTAELLKGTTPGPWFVGNYGGADDATNVRAESSDGPRICPTYGASAYGVDRCLANARLIAAAPALAARVVELEAALRNLESSASDTLREHADATECCAVTRRHCEQARAVLAQESP